MDEGTRAWRRQSVPELRGIELHECDRDSGARAGQSPQSEHGRREQPGSLRIMNHDGTRLSCGLPWLDRSQTDGGEGPWKRATKTRERPRADDAAEGRGRRVWVLKPRSSKPPTGLAWAERIAHSAERAACCLPRAVPPSGQDLGNKRGLAANARRPCTCGWKDRPLTS